MSKPSTAARLKPPRAAEAAEALLADPERIERAASTLRALGNPTRLSLVALLAESGERSVGELGEALGLPQAAVSQQLGVLRLAGLVSVRRDGGFRYYALAVSEVLTLLGCMSRCHLVSGAPASSPRRRLGGAR